MLKATDETVEVTTEIQWHYDMDTYTISLVEPVEIPYNTIVSPIQTEGEAKDLFKCSDCSAEVAWLDDWELCPSCHDELIESCDYCSVEVHKDNAFHDKNGHTACSNCDDGMVICEGCGDFTSEWDENEYCPSCHLDNVGEDDDSGAEANPAEYDVNIQRAVEAWSVACNLHLKQEAANFYLLLCLSLDYPLEAKQAFDQTAGFLADQFSKYLDLAIGGELRHIRSSSELFKASKIVSYIERREYKERQPTWTKSFWFNKFGTYFTIKSHGKERTDYWGYWKGIRERYGLEALTWAYRVFGELWWPASYGGKSWAWAVETLKDYLKGKTTSTFFVDTVFAMWHNGAPIFDKVWSIKGLQKILNRNVEGDYKTMLEYASEEVKALWQKLYGSQ